MLARLCTALILVVTLGCGVEALPPTVSHSAHHHMRQQRSHYPLFLQTTYMPWRSTGRDVCKTPAALPQGFKSYRVEDSKLRVNLPTRPSVVLKNDKANAITEQVAAHHAHVHYVAAHGDPRWMRAQRYDIPPAVMATLEHELGGRVTRSEHIRCAGFQGVDFTLALDDDSAARGRVYANPQGFYLLLATTDTEQPLPHDVDLFLETFRPRD